jgi:predicted AlkP superfamily phosphohydrolase/phosphomutase
MPLVSPPVWTTVATGVSRERHGIREFSSGKRLVSSIDRKAPALWTYTSDAGLRTAVIGWWATYPVEPIDGVIISERALKLREEDFTRLFRGQPGKRELASLVHPPDMMPLVADLLLGPVGGGASDPKQKVVMRMRAEDAAIVRSLVRLRPQAGPFALEMLLLRGVDPVSHYFWRYYEPQAAAYAEYERPTAAECAAYGGVVEEHYRYVDGLLGEVGATPETERVFFVVSDHGFEAGKGEFDGDYLSGTHKTEAAMDGIFAAAGGPLRRGVRLESASILDLAPTVLHLLGLPVPDDMEGRVLTEALDPAWAAVNPVRSAPPKAGQPVVAAPLAAPAVEERLRQELRALGYVE